MSMAEAPSVYLYAWAYVVFDDNRAAASHCSVQLPILSLCKNPGLVLSIPQLCCCPVAGSLSPPQRFQGEIAMLELISESRTKSCAMASYCQERFCSLYLNNQVNQAWPSFLQWELHIGLANSLASCLYLTFRPQNLVIKIDGSDEGCDVSHKWGAGNVSQIVSESCFSFLWV